MNLPSFAMRYKTIVVTMVTMLVVWGIYAFGFSMPRREDPEYTVRTCAISTAWPGTPTEKVEELITYQIEKAVDSIDEVKRVRSTTVVGLSTVFVDAEDSVTPQSIDNVWDKVRARVAKVRMPEDGVKPIVNDEYGDTYIIVFTVSQRPLPGEDTIPKGREYSFRDLDVISEKIADTLKLLPGVAKSEQFGIRNEAIYLETDIGAWSQLGLTTSQIQGLVAQRNIVEPGGDIETSVGRFSIKPGGELNAVGEIESIVVGDGRGSTGVPVRLSELDFEVVRDYEDPPKLICRSGDPTGTRDCAVVALTMKAGSNITEVCQLAKDRVRKMQEVERTIPPDIAVVPVSDQSENVNAKISDVVWNVISAVLIVVAVVYLVVGFRSSMVMAANIPVVVLAAIALVTLFGVQLEQISLASIIIALGLLVDNAVQVCDQSRTNQLEGMEPAEATVKGTNTLSTAMLMGTATTIAAFFPMLIGLEGSKREYVYSLPVTLSVTLGISWVLAMTFCTILAAWFIRPPADPTKPSAPLPWLFDKLERRGKSGPKGDDEPSIVDVVFRKVARAAIDAKFVTIGVSVVLLVGALALPVSSQFFPKDRRDQFAIQVWLPEHVTIEQTDAATKQVEEIVRRLSPVVDENGDPVLGEDGEPLERLRQMRTMVGGGGSRWYLGWNPEPIKPNYAEVLVRTTSGLYTPDMAKAVRRISLEGDEGLGLGPVVGARVIPRELDLGPSVDAPIGFRVYGSGFADLHTMRNLGEKLKAIVRTHPGVYDVHDVWGAKAYQLRVDVDEEKANLAGVTNAQVARTLNTYFSGQQLSTFREGDHTVPVYLRMERPSEKKAGNAEGSLYGESSLDRIDSAYIEGRNGKVPLNSMATKAGLWEPAKIERRELNRLMEVRARNVDGVQANDVVNQLMASDEMKTFIDDLPGGYWFEIGGEMYESKEGQEQMQICLGISVALIVMLLVIQYNGWAKPIIILATLPLALIGALPGLYFTGNALGFMPQLGILSLFGIVLNTGIIFMEFADILIAEAAMKSDGKGPHVGLTTDELRSCLVEAGRQRLLPIFLTTATTIGGLIPLALSGGPLWEGMAWAMIFGLTVATLLTLLVVPAMYAVFVETFGVKPVSVRFPEES